MSGLHILSRYGLIPASAFPAGIAQSDTAANATRSKWCLAGWIIGARMGDGKRQMQDDAR
ncbi:hypothetical protein WS50_04115 [Burkholderia territorii]|nr:hypothetical protein WS47_29330 [Burkholderia territorii]KUZ23384.1 hypothetical protein WS50_04115 [Burkholderia territorii]